MTTKANDSTWYGNVFKSWDSKALGTKPTTEQLGQIHNLGARPGKQALAIAMGLRANGVTGSQIVIACGAPQLNKMRGFIEDGLLKRVPHEPDAKGHTVYKLEVSAKGSKRIETNVKRAAEAAAKAAGEAPAPKAKRVRKAPAKAPEAQAPVTLPAAPPQDEATAQPGM